MRRHAPKSMLTAAALTSLGVVWIVGGVVNALTVDSPNGIVDRSGAMVRAGGVGVLMVTLGVSLMIGPARILTGGGRRERAAAVVAGRARRVLRGAWMVGAGCVGVVVLASAVIAAATGTSRTASSWIGHLGAVLMAAAFAVSLMHE